jgi:hypothetical protein
MSRANDAFAALLAISVGLILFTCTVGFVFSIAPQLTMPPPTKSDQQLCEDRGGVYVHLRTGPNRCFSKEAFK